MIPWHKITATQFEELCARILEKLGFIDVERLPGNTYAIDIRAKYRILEQTQNAVAQCKLRTGKRLGRTDLANVSSYIASHRPNRPNLLILFTNTNLTDDAKEMLSNTCEIASCIFEIKGKSWIEEFVKKEGIKLPTTPDKYLGRRDRAKYIIKCIEDTIEDYKKHEEKITIRMRAAFTSMSNIEHYQKHNIEGLTPEQREELDDLLIKEKDKMKELLDTDCVELKCICWPKLRFLSPYYCVEQRLERTDLLRSFLENSLGKKCIASRQILCDKAGACGNQLIIGNKIAIVANPKSGGYTETSIIEDPQMIDVLIKEYDNLFERILQGRKDFHGLTAERQNVVMLRDALKMLDDEVQKLNQLEELKKKCNSDLKRAFLDRIFEVGLPLPDKVQKTVCDKNSEAIADMDFFYSPNIAVFVDESPHENEHVKKVDTEKRDKLEAMGYTVISIQDVDQIDNLKNATIRMTCKLKSIRDLL